ncbi:unnamed protein product [Caenorhabditis nigoni]
MSHSSLNMKVIFFLFLLVVFGSCVSDLDSACSYPGRDKMSFPFNVLVHCNIEAPFGFQNVVYERGFGEDLAGVNPDICAANSPVSDKIVACFAGGEMFPRPLEFYLNIIHNCSNSGEIMMVEKYLGSFDNVPETLQIVEMNLTNSGMDYNNKVGLCNKQKQNGEFDW